MTSEQLYYEFHLLVNKNNSQQNINIEKPHFVQLYNREQERWVGSVLKTGNNSNQINDLQELLVVDKELELSEIKLNYNSYILPIDNFEYVATKVNCNKEDKANIIFVYNIHPKEVNNYLHDEFSKPSFEWEESICTISENKLLVYKEEFNIDKLYYSYYKKPKQIELAGYVKLEDGKLSQNINNEELSDVYQRQILDGVVKEIMREYENNNGFQLAQERIVN
jgi:hypothetical protein